MRPMKIRSLLVLAGVLLVNALLAQSPHLLNYQGRLTDANGKGAGGPLVLIFSIYSDSSGTNKMWTETHTKVYTDENGVFHELLGGASHFPANLFSTPGERWLGLQVGSEPEMRPLSRMTPVATAVHAHHASKADSAFADGRLLDGYSLDAADGTPIDALIIDEDNNVKIPNIDLMLGEVVIEPKDQSPNAGFIRFGDGTGWKLHLTRRLEGKGGPVNTGDQGVLVTTKDNGFVGIGVSDPLRPLHIDAKGVTNPILINGGPAYIATANELLANSKPGTFIIGGPSGHFIYFFWKEADHYDYDSDGNVTEIINCQLQIGASQINQ